MGVVTWLLLKKEKVGIAEYPVVFAIIFVSFPTDVFKEHFKRFKKVSSIDKCNGVIDFSRVDELPNEVWMCDMYMYKSCMSK